MIGLEPEIFRPEVHGLNLLAMLTLELVGQGRALFIILESRCCMDQADRTNRQSEGRSDRQAVAIRLPCNCIIMTNRLFNPFTSGIKHLDF